MTIHLIAAAVVFLALLIAWAAGCVTGEDAGRDAMKREAIRVGLAHPCSFDGGWRWMAWVEIRDRANLAIAVGAAVPAGLEAWNIKPPVESVKS